MKENYMKSLRAFLLIFILVVTSGCYYSNINGKVVDNATGQPIEGAVVVAQWVKTRGIPGMPIHDLHKITETLTNKEGTFSISGTFGVLIDPPEMIIYKGGYIPWRNDMIFPGGRDSLAKDHEWKNNVTYALDIINDKFTTEQLSQFINHGIIGLGDVPIFHKIHNEISDKVIDESRAKRAKQQTPIKAGEEK